MKTIRKVGGLVSYAAMAAFLAACSANPVDNTNEKKPITTATKKTSSLKTTAVDSTVVVKKTKQLPTMKVAKAALKKTTPVNRKSPVVTVQKPAVKLAKVPTRKVVRKAQALQRNKVHAKRIARAPIKRVVHKVPTAVASRNVVKRPAQQHTARPIAQKKSNNHYRKAAYKKPVVQKARRVAPRRHIPRVDSNTSFGYALSNAALHRTKQRVRYDGRYLKIGYPWGDVPKSIGVCTDVVIRSYRQLGIDLQQEVHKDISNDFYAYPNLTKWGLDKPDPNIDHRRVYNLQAFFRRHKAELPRSRNPRDYKPGDLVTWMVGPTFPHIGVVVNKRSPADPNRFMIVHNVGAGPVVEDILFSYPMTGHYRYTPKHRAINPSLLFAKTPAPASVQRKRQQNAMTYAQLLKASEYLKTAQVTPKKTKVVKAPKASPIYLSQLDSVRLQALLKK